MPSSTSENGLTAYEYPFTKGINIGDETAKKISEQAKKYNITEEDINSAKLHIFYHFT